MAAVIGEEPARFSVHFDGPITLDHMLTVRAMARTYEHIQRAIDRSYLIGKHGSVYKHARLKAEDYAEADFRAEYPREGGIFLDAVKRGAHVPGEIIDRIAAAIDAPFQRALEGGLDEAAVLRDQLTARREYVRDMGRQDVQTLQQLIDNPPPNWAEQYSKRSILKEIDQLTNQITPEHVDGSTVEIGLFGNHSRSTYGFTPQIAERFHAIVAAREMGPAVLVNAKIRNLDRGNRYSKPKAKIVNLDSGREVVLHLSTEADFHLLHPHHTSDQVLIFASPFVEAGGFDLRGGDLVFVGVAA